jgi:hypothetical protein
LRPTPAPTRQAAAPVQAPAAPFEEEAASWEKLVSDTDDPTAYLDTTPKSGKRSGASRKRPSGRNLQAPTVLTRRLWIVIGVATAAVLLLVALITWIAIAVSSGQKQQQGQTPRPPLRVDPSGAGKAYTTIQEALNHASAHDHIHLMTNISEGNVNIPQKENLVIESAPGQMATWKFPAGLSDSDKMLAVVSVTGFELKHVTLDGSQKAKSLITLYGSCPGLKLTDLELRYFKDYGVSVIGCDGTPTQPVDLFNLRITTDKSSQTGLFFDYTGNSIIKRPKYITVRGCSFAGEGAKLTATKLEDIAEVKLEGTSPFTLAPPKK